MKVKCKQAFHPATNGILGFGAKPMRPIDGLTLHKEYTAEVVNILSGGGKLSVDNSVEFLVYNDKGEWETYNVDYFEPA